VQTNLPLLQRLLDEPEFVSGQYDTSLMARAMDIRPQVNGTLRDLAIVAAVAYELREQVRQPSVPDRLLSGWHRSSRQI
jgi:acetyl/propionyl-CoA carboxylase alpha subunit